MRALAGRGAASARAEQQQSRRRGGCCQPRARELPSSCRPLPHKSDQAVDPAPCITPIWLMKNYVGEVLHLGCRGCGHGRRVLTQVYRRFTRSVPRRGPCKAQRPSRLTLHDATERLSPAQCRAGRRVSRETSRDGQCSRRSNPKSRHVLRLRAVGRGRFDGAPPAQPVCMARPENFQCPCAC
jgi:hypothetical protein